MLDPVGDFGLPDHCRPMAAFLLYIFPIGIGCILACTSVTLFDCPLGQGEAVVPPGCIPLAGFSERDRNVGGPVDEASDIGDGTEGVFFAAEVGEIHIVRLDVGSKGTPVCLVPGTSWGGGWVTGRGKGKGNGNRAMVRGCVMVDGQCQY